ncbi:MAG: hypothetical protein MUF45_16355 [Spirosomaceae bacterium]|jgi:hypothetical protein|nr:hypothetical protein [Spirosomataceae bacterium]
MKVINIHKRVLNQPVSKIGELLDTLATNNDKMLATDKWPPMRLDKGLQVGSKGGHGSIRYFVTAYNPEKSITFQFDLKGFNGFHRFNITELGTNQTELLHVIDMNTTGTATLKWVLAIRWLHDAYIEDAFDKVENLFTEDKKTSKWNLWVRFLRQVMKPKKK